MAGVNQVFLGAVKIMDISDSTVTPETLGDGVTAYDKTGEKITGTAKSASVSDDGQGNLVFSGVTVVVGV